MVRSFLLKRPNTKLIIAVLIFVTALVYSNSLKNDFVWDDYFVIVDNDFVKSWENFPAIFTPAYFTPLSALTSAHITGSGETTYRPAVTVSYFVDYRFWKLNPFGYHLSNLLLHIANVILLFLFTYLLLKNGYMAFLAALFFAVHPVNTEAVNVISFREDLLVFLFCVSSFILYIKHDSFQGGKKALFYIFSVILFFLALFSKEMAITLPVMLFLYDYFFVFNQERRRLFAHFLSRYGGYISAAVFYLAVWFGLKGGIGDLVAEYPYPGGNFYTNALTMSRVVSGYVWWLIFPVNIHAALPENTPALTLYSIFKPEAVFSITLILSLLTAAFIFRKRFREISFSILWFLIMLLPVSNIIPIACIIAVRYLYIPMVGFCIVAATIVFKLYNIKSRLFSRQFLNKLAGIIVILLILFYSLLTFTRNSAWKNNVILWRELVAYYPELPEARLMLGDQLRRAGLSDQAANEYGIAIRLNPDLPQGYNSLGIVLGEAGRYPEAVDYFEKAIDRDKKYLSAYNNCAITYAKMGRWDEARLLWLKVLTIDPSYKEAGQNLEKLTRLGK